MNKKPSAKMTDSKKKARVVVRLRQPRPMMSSGFRVEINGTDARVRSMSPITLDPIMDDDFDHKTLTFYRPVDLSDRLFEDVVRTYNSKGAGDTEVPTVEIFYTINGEDVAKRTIEVSSVGEFAEGAYDANVSDQPLYEQLTITPENIHPLKPTGKHVNP